jgi:hypothetical protein
VVVAVNGPVITNDIGLLTRAAMDGVGLTFMSEDQAAPHLASGTLPQVLEDRCPPYTGFFRTTRAGASIQRRSAHSLTRCVSEIRGSNAYIYSRRTAAILRSPVSDRSGLGDVSQFTLAWTAERRKCKILKTERCPSG